MDEVDTTLPLGERVDAYAAVLDNLMADRLRQIAALSTPDISENTHEA